MSNLALLIVLLILLVGSIIWLVIVKKDIPIFTKRTFRYIFFSFLIFAVLGATGLLIKEPVHWNAIFLAILLQGVFLGFGFLHHRLLRTYHTHWNDGNMLRLTIPFTVFMLLVCAIPFFVVFWMVEIPFFKISDGLADNITLSMIIASLPFTVSIAHQFWLSIPIVIKEMVPWILPTGESPPIIERTANSIRIFLKVPPDYRAKNHISIDLQAPLRHSLGELFHKSLHDNAHSVSRQTEIEIAENNERAKQYSWLFYKKEKSWWGHKKEYINPNLKMNQLRFQSGEEIFVERMKTWEKG